MYADIGNRNQTQETIRLAWFKTLYTQSSTFVNLDQQPTEGLVPRQS